MGAEPPSPDSLQGEGEVVLAGLAVAHQVTGLLAQPQQRLRVRPADGPVVPAEGRGWAGLGTEQAPQQGTCPGTSPQEGLQPQSGRGKGGGTVGNWRQGAGTNRMKCGAKEERKKQVCPRAPHGVATGLPSAGARLGQPLWAGRTHHWLSRGRAGSILSPTKGPGSVVSVFVLLRLVEPCLRAALAFSSLQGEVRPYPSPSDGPARQTHITSWDPHLGWQEEQSHLHHTGSPHSVPSPRSKQGQGSSWAAAHCRAQAGSPPGQAWSH